MGILLNHLWRSISKQISWPSKSNILQLTVSVKMNTLEKHLHWSIPNFRCPMAFLTSWINENLGKLKGQGQITPKIMLRMCTNLLENTQIHWFTFQLPLPRSWCLSPAPCVPALGVSPADSRCVAQPLPPPLWRCGTPRGQTPSLSGRKKREGPLQATEI